MDVLVAHWNPRIGTLSVDGSEPIAMAITADVADHILRNAGYDLAGEWVHERGRVAAERIVFREARVTDGS